MANLVPNPDLEVNSTGWNANGGSGGAVGSAARDSNAAHSGSFGYRVTWTTGGTFSSGAYVTAIPVNPGWNISGTAWVRSSTACQMQLTFENANGTGIPVDLTANVWTQLTVSNWVVIGGVTTVNATMYTTAAATLANGTTIDFDDLFVDLTITYNPPPDIPPNVPVDPASVAQALVAVSLSTP